MRRWRTVVAGLAAMVLAGCVPQPLPTPDADPLRPQIDAWTAEYQNVKSVDGIHYDVKGGLSGPWPNLPEFTDADGRWVGMAIGGMGGGEDTDGTYVGLALAVWPSEAELLAPRSRRGDVLVLEDWVIRVVYAHADGSGTVELLKHPEGLPGS